MSFVPVLVKLRSYAVKVIADPVLLVTSNMFPFWELLAANSVVNEPVVPGTPPPTPQFSSKVGSGSVNVALHMPASTPTSVSSEPGA